MNETIANETIGQNVVDAGELGLDKVLNMEWTGGIATFLNSLLHTDVFTGTLVTSLLPAITLLFLYWKWNSIVQFIHAFGQTIIILLIVFVAIKGLGVI